MAAKMRRVTLLGAFEIAPDLEPPVRDGLILGSRRDKRGFVIETSRENIEQIVTASNPEALAGHPVRLTLAVGPMLERFGGALLRVELRPTEEVLPGDPNGTFVQGCLVFRIAAGRTQRLLMTATEAIQVATSKRLPIMADASLLQLDVSQFLDEIDSLSHEAESESDAFKNFVDNVTASDFAKYLKNRPDEPGAES